jgi:hypothetical protein
VAAKLVVTAHEGGSRIALVGASGKELLSSVVFSEPRAKGATLRSLKGMLGDAIIVEDHTLASPRGRAGEPETTNGQSAKRVAKAPRRPAARRRSEADSDSPTTTTTTKAAKATKTTKASAKSS